MKRLHCQVPSCPRYQARHCLFCEYYWSHVFEEHRASLREATRRKKDKKDGGDWSEWYIALSHARADAMLLSGDKYDQYMAEQYMIAERLRNKR